MKNEISLFVVSLCIVMGCAESSANLSDETEEFIEESTESDEIDEPHEEPIENTEACKTPADCVEVPISCDVCQENDRQCEGQDLLVCRKNDAGCLVWTRDRDCAQTGWCDPLAKRCDFCEEKCPDFPKRCGVGGVQTCHEDAHGCAVWHTVPCERDEHCDAFSVSCVDGCENRCQMGEKRCENDTEYRCEPSEEGCSTWVEDKICGFGQYCIENQCDEGCGEDCDPFTIIIMPDTQHYTISSSGIYQQQTQWIVDHRESENIRMVMHLGDVTDGNRKIQYERAIAAHNLFAAAGIPYTISTGNHDYKKGDSGVDFVARDRSLFAHYFNDAYFRNGFEDASWFHGFKSSANMFATFHVGHLKFAVFALEFFPRKDVLCWAENLISTQLRDHYIILTTHGYLTHDASNFSSGKYSSGSNGDIPFGAMGADIYTELAARHSNILMVISGHVSDAEHRERTTYAGNQLHEMLVDYQSEKPCTSSTCDDACGALADAGNGWLRKMTIDPRMQRNEDGSLKPNVHVSTLSVIDEYQQNKRLFCSELNKSESYQYYASDLEASDHQYDLTWDFSKAIDYRDSSQGRLAFTSRNINEIANDTEDGSQLRPAIAVHRESGAFAAVWEDDGDDDGIYDIKARIFCAGGCPDNKQAVVAQSDSISLMHPDIAMDGSGNFVVTWEIPDTAVAIRGFYAFGKEMFPKVQILSASQPSVAMDNDGHSVLVWTQDDHVVMRGFHPDGSAWFAQKWVSEGTDPDVACDKSGHFVLTWVQDHQIMARGFAPSGAETMPTFRVNAKSGNYTHPAIAMNASGQFYIAYEDADKNRILARGFTASGESLKEETVLSTTKNATEPAVCLSDHGKAVVTWTAPELNDGDIRKVTISAAQQLVKEGSAATFTQGLQTTSDIGCTADGRYVLLFSDDRPSRGKTDILARGFDE